MDNYYFIIEPAEDLPGQWNAHCLNLDVVTIGESFEHAKAMLKEAIEMTLEDRASGADKTPLRCAPSERFDLVETVVDEGQQIGPTEWRLDVHGKPVIAGQIVV